MKNSIFAPLLLCVLLSQLGQPVKAGWGKLTVDSGGGDELTVKHGLFGHKTEVKDRLGDGFVKSHSIFGTKTEEISVLGNGIKYHKGLLGFSSASGHTMFGDSLSSHKNPLYRTTNVNMSGINSLLGNYLHPQPSTAAPLPQGQGYNGGPRLEPPPAYNGNQNPSGSLEPFANQPGN